MYSFMTFFFLKLVSPSKFVIISTTFDKKYVSKSTKTDFGENNNETLF